MSEFLLDRYHGVFGFLLGMFGTAAAIVLVTALVTTIVIFLAGMLESIGLLPDRKTWWKP